MIAGTKNQGSLIASKLIYKTCMNVNRGMLFG
jgi:hypothetical protein